MRPRAQQIDLDGQLHDLAPQTERMRLFNPAPTQLAGQTYIDTDREAGAMGTETRIEPWTFNGDYRDLAQIIPYIDDYWHICAELSAAGKYPYHAEFYGRIPGLGGARALAKSGPDTGKVVESPETPIYLLAQLRHLVEGHERLAETLEAGYRRFMPWADDPRDIVKFASIAVFDLHYHRHVYTDARLVLNADGSLQGILPKGKRTHGRSLTGTDAVYVRGDQ
jgi:hypothetical protein